MTDSTILQPEGLEQRYERYKEKIKHFTIMNDIFMRNVLKEISCTEYILQVIMNRTGLKVIDQTLQKDYKNLQGRSAILDCVAKDAENNHFNVEIQGDNTELGRLMHDLHCKEADKMYSNILATRVHQLKETAEGVNQMCQELEEIYNEGVERGEQSGFLRGEQSGELKKARETTLALLEMGMSVKQIAKAVNLSVETIQNWISEA